MMTKEAVEKILIAMAGGILTVTTLSFLNWVIDGGITRVIFRPLLQDAVVAFDAECPEGWTDVGSTQTERFAGRVIIAAGKIAGNDGSSRTFTRGERGGSATHTLTLEELPTHKHEVVNFEVGHTVEGNGHRRRIDSDDGPGWPGTTSERLETNEQGGSQPHNNMPPYVALNFCKKT